MLSRLLPVKDQVEPGTSSGLARAHKGYVRADARSWPGRPLESATGVSVMRLKREMMVRIRSCKREGDAKWLSPLSRTPAT